MVASKETVTDDQAETRIQTGDPKLVVVEEDVAVNRNQTTSIRERTSLSAGELDAPSSLRVKGSPSAVEMA